MEWEKAKKFVIILLVCLNVVLAVLYQSQQKEHSVSAAQEKAVFEVLSKNGITMYTDLITEYVPMRRLVCKKVLYTKERLEQIFFDGKKTVVIPSDGRILYRGDDSILTMQGGKGEMVYDVSVGKENLTKDQATDQAEAYMKHLQKEFQHFVLYGTQEQEKGYCVKFYQKYEGQYIFSNYIFVYVSEDGVYRTEFCYQPIEGYIGERKDIFYADEALLTFMRKWQEINPKQNATIQRMDLGYMTTEMNGRADGSGYAVPCYMISVMEHQQPFFINAYTCQMIKPYQALQESEKKDTTI